MYCDPNANKPIVKKRLKISIKDKSKIVEGLKKIVNAPTKKNESATKKFIASVFAFSSFLTTKTPYAHPT